MKSTSKNEMDMQRLMDQLKEWRDKKARFSNVKPYFVLTNKTIEELALVQPMTKDALEEITGMGSKKILQYGSEILSIIRTNVQANGVVSQQEDDVMSVSMFLDEMNEDFGSRAYQVKGEIGKVSVYSTAVYFTLKDEGDESVVDCVMFSYHYQLMGIQLQEGMRVIVQGCPSIYKKYGKFSLKTRALSLVGEGALYKAYLDLKHALERNGVFSPERKKPLPFLPKRIGVITSKDGAVIHDFLQNIGRHGFDIQLYHSSVEGINAVHDLISAFSYFRKNAHEFDLVVIIRGGGSFESLQAFNNEAVIYEMLSCPLPVLAGIGHDKDVSLLSLAADMACSTPTACANVLSKPFQEIASILQTWRVKLLSSFSRLLFTYHREYEKYQWNMQQQIQKKKMIYQSQLDAFSSVTRMHLSLIQQKKEMLSHQQDRLQKGMIDIHTYYQNQLIHTQAILTQYNPHVLLKRGYSIMYKNGKIVKSVRELASHDKISIQLGEGSIDGIIEQIYE